MTKDEKTEVDEKVGEALEENFVSLGKKDEKEKKVEHKEGKASWSKKEKTEGTEDEGMEEGDDSKEEDGKGVEGEEMDADKSAAKRLRATTPEKRLRRKKVKKTRNLTTFSWLGRC